MIGGSTSARRIGAREAAVAVGRPLHRRAHAVAVAEMDVVAHADLVAVVDHRRAGHREQQAVHQLDAAAVVLQQRRQPAADAEIDARAPVGGVGLPQIVALAGSVTISSVSSSWLRRKIAHWQLSRNLAASAA